MRSWWHHEQVSIAAAVAAALHHSARPASNYALREPKNQAQRKQKQHPTGERPRLFVQPCPLQRDRTVRRSAGDGLPTLALPTLAWSEGEAVHSAALSFLLLRALMKKEEEAEEAQRKAKKTASCSTCASSSRTRCNRGTGP